jgi:hypothetical protein
MTARKPLCRKHFWRDQSEKLSGDNDLPHIVE